MEEVLFFSAISIAVGLFVGWLVWGRKRPFQDRQDEASSAIEEVKEKTVVSESGHDVTATERDKALRLSEAKIKFLTEELSSLKARADGLKSKYTSLNSEKEKRISDLENQLKEATEGKVDDVAQKKLEELAKLQKQVKGLEDDVDDLEDDIDDYKKKLNKKDVQLSETQDELDRVSREAKAVKEELGKTKEELLIKSKDLSIKAQSISFVQEILTAKITDTDEERKLGQRVDELVDYIRNEFEDAVSSVYHVEDGKQDPIFGDDLDTWAATAKKSWLSRKTTIAFVGEFSAGKTSIVNRLLSQDDPSVPLLPVSTKATTAIPTYISGADHQSYRFVTPGNQIKALSEKTFTMVNKDVLGQINGISSLISYFVMRYKNPNLNKLSILDTPGFNSNDPEDASRTIGVINECDALFWVFDVNAGTVNRSSIKLIKQYLKRPLFVVINKIDTKSKPEVDQVENLIRKTLADEHIAVQGFIRFSAKARLSDMMTPIKSISHDSVRDNYIDNLMDKAKDMLAQQETKAKKAHAEAIRAQKKSDAQVDQFVGSLSKLQSDCETAAGIPHWETHVFSKDRYEMSADEGEALGNILAKIRDDHPQTLATQYDSQMEKVGELVKAWQTEGYERSVLNNIQASITTLKKKIKAVSPTSTSI